MRFLVNISIMRNEAPKEFDDLAEAKAYAADALNAQLTYGDEESSATISEIKHIFTRKPAQIIETRCRAQEASVQEALVEEKKWPFPKGEYVRHGYARSRYFGRVEKCFEDSGRWIVVIRNESGAFFHFDRCDLRLDDRTVAGGGSRNLEVGKKYRTVENATAEITGVILSENGPLYSATLYMAAVIARGVFFYDETGKNSVKETFDLIERII